MKKGYHKEKYHSMMLHRTWCKLCPNILRVWFVRQVVERIEVIGYLGLDHRGL